MRGLVLMAATIVGGLVIAGVIWSSWPTPDAPEFALLSDEELSIYQTLETSDIRSLKVDSTSGPIIKVNSPVGFALASPVDFDIRVEPRGGVPVDMGSIRIEYRLGPAWINLTRRVLKYAKINGSHLSAQGADLPSGKHALRVSIEDQQKRKTQATVSFTVTSR